MRRKLWSVVIGSILGVHMFLQGVYGGLWVGHTGFDIAVGCVTIVQEDRQDCTTVSIAVSILGYGQEFTRQESTDWTTHPVVW